MEEEAYEEAEKDEVEKAGVKKASPATKGSISS